MAGGDDPEPVLSLVVGMVLDRRTRFAPSLVNPQALVRSKKHIIDDAAKEHRHRIVRRGVGIILPAAIDDAGKVGTGGAVVNRCLVQGGDGSCGKAHHSYSLKPIFRGVGTKVGYRLVGVRESVFHTLEVVEVEVGPGFPSIRNVLQ